MKTQTKSQIKSPVEMPINQHHTGKGNPNAILIFGTELNNRQKKILSKLKNDKSRCIVPKKSVNMADLSALTAETGDEFAMFTLGSKRLIIRGNSRMVNINTEEADKMNSEGYRWSGHTHPGIDFFSLFASDGDFSILNCFEQNYSVIYNSKGDFRKFEKRRNL